VTWVWTILGFAALVILHELGHFTAAKMVGMRVERFALFFPPLLFKVRRGETEYGIGTIPLGGYVKISGMNPVEELPEEVKPRAYYSQPVWKRVFVIAAGPAVNIVLAFVIMWAVFLHVGQAAGPAEVAAVETGTPAAKVLKPGDQIVKVDGRTPAGADISAQMDSIGKLIAAHNGTPVTLTIRRDGAVKTVSATPFMDNKQKPPRYRIGFEQEAGGHAGIGVGEAARTSVSNMWYVTHTTVSKIAQIFKPADRKQLQSVVGATAVTHNAFNADTSVAFMFLAVISLSLGIINLFPFLPLDGGHIFWAVAEKVRGRAISFSVMEKAGFVGFALVIMLFAIGFTNDIGRITGDGFGLTR
jgi:regulator of sigma E protease